VKLNRHGLKLQKLNSLRFNLAAIKKPSQVDGFFIGLGHTTNRIDENIVLFKSQLRREFTQESHMCIAC
jgi:hypothetical protein